MAERVLGIIGGSGLYDMDGIEDATWNAVDTPWGAPSDEILTGILNGAKVRFLPRHGRGHVQTPSSINYRANIDALKRLGCTDILSISACGSLKEELPPGHFVLADQFIDRTFGREKSFFGPGCVAHVSMAHPVSSWLSDLAEKALADLDVPHSRGGTYLAMEGPQFSSVAESELYRSWGCSVIGMTNMPEAKLAREAELRYITVAMVTDYDCWHPDHDHVDVEMVIKTLLENAHHGKDLVRGVAGLLNDWPSEPDCGCDRALDNALITAPHARESALVAKLDAIAGRVL